MFDSLDVHIYIPLSCCPVLLLLYDFPSFEESCLSSIHFFFWFSLHSQLFVSLNLNRCYSLTSCVLSACLNSLFILYIDCVSMFSSLWKVFPMTWSVNRFVTILQRRRGIVSILLMYTDFHIGNFFRHNVIWNIMLGNNWLILLII